jgi:hypothetical protein
MFNVLLPNVDAPLLPVVVSEMLFCLIEFKESTPFCLHARVDRATVSALTVPVLVIVEKFIPVPAATDVTVPVPAKMFHALSADRS